MQLQILTILLRFNYGRICLFGCLFCFIVYLTHYPFYIIAYIAYSVISPLYWQLWPLQPTPNHDLRKRQDDKDLTLQCVSMEGLFVECMLLAALFQFWKEINNSGFKTLTDPISELNLLLWTLMMSAFPCGTRCSHCHGGSGRWRPWGQYVIGEELEEWQFASWRYRFEVGGEGAGRSTLGAWPGRSWAGSDAISQADTSSTVEHVGLCCLISSAPKASVTVRRWPRVLLFP